jgi:hypothetical protein
MYALARNSWKFQNRDKRISKSQHIEFEPLAPDTAEEIILAMRLLEIWTAKASMRQKGTEAVKNDDQLADMGRKLLREDEKLLSGLEVLGENLENSKRKTVILKPYKAYHAYRDMLNYYALSNLLAYFRANPKANLTKMLNDLSGERIKEWVNLGGQIMQKDDLDKIRADIGTGKLLTWKDIHNRYDALWDKYKADKQKHALATWIVLSGKKQITRSDLDKALGELIVIQQFICDQVFASRKKDYDNPFRRATFRNDAEMKATIGTIEDNSFIIQVRQETEEIRKVVEDVRKRI